MTRSAKETSIMRNRPDIPPRPRSRRALVLVLLLALAPAALAAAGAEGPAVPSKETSMTRHATGPFDVKITPQPFAGPAEDPALGRMWIEKHYHGDLEATAHGQMLTAGTDTRESGVYVAVERVTGTLQGRTGTFALHHRGIMTKGQPQLEIAVVPGSGTGALAGLTGSLHVTLAEGGQHSYDFEHTLPEGP
jgi:hypothetical protein